MKLFGKKDTTLAGLTKNAKPEQIHSIMRTWLKDKYDFVVSDELLPQFVNAYLEGGTVKATIWDATRNRYFFFKLVEETRRNQTDSHYLYFIVGKRPTGTKWESVLYPSKEDVYHFNPISHQINVARQMMREQLDGTYDAFLPLEKSL